MKINQKIRTTKYIFNLARLDESLNDPALIGLLDDGWEVFSYIPVEDNGPKVILLLKESKTNIIKNKINYFEISNTIILLLILISSVINQIW